MLSSLSMPQLPLPDTDALAHSERLSAIIRQEIQQQGSISFARYMQLALYAPGMGYYNAGAYKLGASGDFVTAPEISPLFSRAIAQQCAQVLAELKGGDILELGAGSGVMAADILLELAALQQLPQHYYILEISADLKQRQQQLLQQRIPQFYSRIHWLESLTDIAINGVILANEVLDAMPVHKFCMNETVNEFHVVTEKNNFAWQLIPATNHELITHVEKLAIDFPPGYISEINLNLLNWINSLSAVLTRGLILLVDYGFPRHEYYHPDRNNGTLMCHYRHYAHDAPLLWPGLQDITAHVDFTAVAEAADNTNLNVAGYTAQAYFLLNCDIMKLAQAQMTDDINHAKVAQQIKKLTYPAEMGELFKAIALTRNLDILLMGFREYDLRRKL